MRYRGIARAQRRARANAIERAIRVREESGDPSTIPDLWAAIYRLQARNRDGALGARIRVLSEEEQRRRGEAQCPSVGERGA
jgi:hypothetical protein